ncbi:GNAT family N-acetyltransferase [Hymenobacter sp. BT523]|uniref:GNAT family N-acetyltransferase n=1 Tax=Hymenobacter sp. BT523 TaxID=2795725 RepID=UPI0018EB13B9|nr:GNAT family N-acetyltransferase [Hymenobacter sp. BT523]MBJ6111134.1 GNAT family N-acetyltransferase [Hymenobacter sp. BT523]
MQHFTNQLVCRPLLEFTSAEACEAINRSFEEYLVPMVFDAASFERRFRGENLDAQASKIWFRNDELVGLVLIARRGWNSRVAAMGLVVGARGKGYGHVMLTAALAEARARGDQNMLLEVFTTNERAYRLYEKLGFRTTRQLHMLQCEAGRAYTRVLKLSETDPREVARVIAKETEAELPWMIAAETMAAMAPPVRAFHLENKAYAVVRADANRTLLLSLVVPKQWRRQGHGSQLLHEVEAAYAHNNLMCYMLWEGPELQFMLARGWKRQELALFEMVVPLA